MSLDFPNRADWLKVRATPRKLPAGRMIHVSAPLVTVRDPITGNLKTVVGRGITLNLGSKQRKRKALAAKQARITARKAERRHGLIMDRRADTQIAANEEFDAMKREQEADAA